MKPSIRLLVCALAAALVAPARSPASPEEPAASASGSTLGVEPPSAVLRGRGARLRLIATVATPSGSAATASAERDVTHAAQWASSDPAVARVGADGALEALGSGRVTVTARADGLEGSAEVEIVDGESWPQPSFESDVQPVLTRYGCNSGPCHGKQRGQNGFWLSLLGFDDEFDYRAVVRDARGRRVFPAAPERSLLLLKPTAAIEHGGGELLEPGSSAHATLVRWIAAGMPRDAADAPGLDRIEVFPPSRLLTAGSRQQLAVTAVHTDGSRRDVTHLTKFRSSESVIATVDENGHVTAGPLPGEAAILARYRGRQTTFSLSIPLSGELPDSAWSALPSNGALDDLVWRKLRRLAITPSGPCSDSQFLRRAFLDVIGRQPTADETRRFLADERGDKRERLVDELLARPEYADHQANKWVDLLRPNPYRVGIKSVRSLDRWVRERFRRNEPWDQIVRDLLTAQGSCFRNGATVVYRDRRSPDELVTMVSQLFLGIRLECAKCHQHPFEIWSQEHYFSLAAYFARVGRKGTGLSPPISGGEELIFLADRGSVAHPRTGRTLEPAPLFGEAPATVAGADPREALAHWITGDANPFFARVFVNRVWADLMGRGLVEPVDDLRESNPPTNAELLEELARGFREDGYDVKRLHRRILLSRVYQLDSTPTERNVADTRNHSRYYRQRLRAETLLDAVADITGVPERFSAMPPGSRAVELWTHRADSVFLDTFGRPDPNQDPPCFRTSDTTVVQALHLMNSPDLHAKISSEGGRIAQLLAREATSAEIVEELWLSVYARFPTVEEVERAVSWLEREGRVRRRQAEDLLWALLNTPEFLFKH